MTNKSQRNTQIDMATMHIIFGNNTQAMTQYLEELITLATNKRNEIMEALQQKDAKRALNGFHFLKGPIGSCGFTKLYALCEKSEACISNNDWVEALNCCDALGRALTALQSEVKRIENAQFP